MSDESDIRSCVRQMLFLHVLMNHMPMSVIVDELYMYPRCGLESVKKL